MRRHLGDLPVQLLRWQARNQGSEKFFAQGHTASWGGDWGKTENTTPALRLYCSPSLSDSANKPLLSVCYYKPDTNWAVGSQIRWDSCPQSSPTKWVKTAGRERKLQYPQWDWVGPQKYWVQLGHTEAGGSFETAVEKFPNFQSSFLTVSRAFPHDSHWMGKQGPRPS